jgi:putative membrane protein
LVLTVDRDNDLGVKAGIRGPVIGRKATLSAALRLGLADPEESDTNAILGALHRHDKLNEEIVGDDEVQIALLTGDVRVGARSDRAIAIQLDEVIQDFQPDRAILVTDGADDEAALPIITSRVRVDHVEKVIVRQSKGIESTYYYVVKAIEDPRWRARLLVPIAAVMIILGLGLIIPNGTKLIGAMPLIFGIWVLAKGLGWEQQLERLLGDMRAAASGSLLTSLLWALALVSLMIAAVTVIQVFYGTSLEIQEWASAILPDSTGFDVGAVNNDIAVWVIAIDNALSWFLVAFFSLFLSLGVLRWKEGSFTGQSVMLLATGAVAFFVISAINEVALGMLGGQDLNLSVQSVSDTWSLPVLAILGRYLLSVMVESLTEDDDGPMDNQFYGV